MKYLLPVFFFICALSNAFCQINVLIDEPNDSVRIYETYISENLPNASMPIKYKDGLIFNSKMDTAFYSLYYTDLESEIVKIEISNQNYNVGKATVSSFNDDIFFTMNSCPKHTFNSGEKICNLAVFEGKILDFKIQDFDKIGICKNEFNYWSPSISVDGTNIVIVTNEGGSYQLVEIFKDNRNTWVKGDVLYTSPDKSPILNPSSINQDEIYFACSIKGSLSGFDIYKIVKKNGKWQTPENVKYLNSEFDDTGVCFVTNNSGYITTNRYTAEDNIYYFQMRGVGRD